MMRAKCGRYDEMCSEIMIGCAWECKKCRRWWSSRCWRHGFLNVTSAALLVYVPDPDYEAIHYSKEKQTAPEAVHCPSRTSVSFLRCLSWLSQAIPISCMYRVFFSPHMLYLMSISTKQRSRNRWNDHLQLFSLQPYKAMEKSGYCRSRPWMLLCLQSWQPVRIGCRY